MSNIQTGAYRIPHDLSHLAFVSRHIFFFFNDTATTEIYTLSLHDALPICRRDNASRIQRVFFPEPLPSSATRRGDGRRLTISAEYSFSKRVSARVSPYSGSTQMASKSAEPTSSYKYFEGSSRWPGLVRLSRTSAANSDTCWSDKAGVAMVLSPEPRPGSA